MTRCRLGSTVAAVAVAWSSVAARAPAAPANPAPAGLPASGAPALYRGEPASVVPRGWTFPDAFPRTSGSSRLAGGAAFWSGFLYDDHGARGVPVQGPIVGLSPSTGTFTYPPGPARDNGADIAAAAVGLDATEAVFRVDWQTLEDAAVPLAMWALDTDADASTGATAWPAGALLQSPGVEDWLLVSGRGAWLLSAAGTRASIASVGGTLAVDTAARSFVVRVPTKVLLAKARWTVRLAAGLANPSGDAFAPVPPDRGSLPGQPPVYDVGFRTHAQETLGRDNWWRESAQAAALATGDVREFAIPIDWSRLASRATTAEPTIVGWTNGWYRSSIELGQGVAPATRGYAADFAPNFVGRRQPYGIFVPRSANHRKASPVTMLLHSINVQHNQFAIWNPVFLERICGERRSMCIAPLGRGPDGWWAAEAELDMWEVWHAVSMRYRLEPTRTILAGYSMGGYGVYRLGLENPDVFAGAVVLAGAPACSVRVVKGVEESVASGVRECDYEADTSPLVENARDLPFYIGHDALDELAPVSSAIEQAAHFDALGYRNRLEVHTNEDHVSWSMTGTFDGARQWLAQSDRRVARNPARITYGWYAEHQRFDLQTGPRDVWWIGDLRARSNAPGFRARVAAVSLALDEATRRVERQGPQTVVNADGLAVTTETYWQGPGSRAPRRAVIRLDLAGVASLTVDVRRGGLRAGRAGAVEVSADGHTALKFCGLGAGARVRTPDGAVHATTADRCVTLIIPSGRSALAIEYR